MASSPASALAWRTFLGSNLRHPLGTPLTGAGWRINPLDIVRRGLKVALVLSESNIELRILPYDEWYSSIHVTHIPNVHPFFRLAVVGDIHNQWSEADVFALKKLNVDMTLFVGDIGNEAVDLVSRIASINVEKAVILGNHDAFFTNAPMIRATLDRRRKIDAVNAQLDALGEDHVGFKRKDVFGKPVSIIGARPFSQGGREKHPLQIQNLYGYNGFAEYAEVIVELALTVPEDNSIVILGHNGPYGLGTKRHDICGVDFRREEGDHGDGDLQLALVDLEDKGRSPSLVVFGHMHHKLKGGGFRRRVVFVPSTGTLYFNAAVVSRVKRVNSRNKTIRHFSLIEMENKKVARAEDVYVTVGEDKVEDELLSVPLFERIEHSSHEQIKVYNTHLGLWEEHIVAK